jgi:hypothetical protein
MAHPPHHNHTHTNSDAGSAGGAEREWECGDILAHHLSLTLARALAHANILTSHDCWRLALACLQLDPTGRMVAALLDNGAIPTLFQWKHKTDLHGQCVRLKDPHPHAHLVLALPDCPQRAVDAPELSPGTFVVADLTSCFFQGYTLAGWATRLNAQKALEKLLLGGK